jgi:DNA repair protein RAD50
MDQIGEIKVTKGDIKYLSENLEAKLESSKNLKEENENAGHDQKIKAKQEGIRQLEDARENLHAELVGLNRESDTRAKLSLKRSDVTRKQQGIEALLSIFRISFEYFEMQRMRLQFGWLTDVDSITQD